MYDSRNLPDFTKATIDKRIKELKEDLYKTKSEVKIPEEETKEVQETQEPIPLSEPISTK